MKPRISVVMPVHNGEDYIEPAVDSVLNQTFSDFELIVVDDGSSDRTVERLQKYPDSRLRIYQQLPQGLAPALNQGLRLCQGEFVARMDADDICLPKRFERQVTFLEAHPEVVAVGSEVLLIDPDGWPIALRGHHQSHPQIEKELLAGLGGAITHPTLMVRQQALAKIGGYSEARPTNEDLQLYLQLGEVGQLANLPEVLLHYRVHFKSVNHTQYQQQIVDAVSIVEEAIARRGLTDQKLPQFGSRKGYGDPLVLHLLWAWQAFRAGNFATSRKHVLAAYRLNPRCFLNPRLVGAIVLPPRLTQFLRQTLRLDQPAT